MNNLAQTKQNAKQSFLDNQQAQMLEVYRNAGDNERAAVIRQIDSFLPIIKKDEKTFWLKFRQKLERLNEQSA